MADPKLVARLNSGPCCWRSRELTEVRLLWTVCYWESLLMALTGGAGPPSAFPLLKVDRQCCNGDSFSQADPLRTLVFGSNRLFISAPEL
jgi:hypothetical protein